MSIKVLALLAAPAVIGAPVVSAAQNVIAPADTLKITVLGEPDYPKQVTVADDGSISLPLVKDVKVAGLTTTAAAVAIARALGRYIKNPDVTVELFQKARGQVTVAGQVKTPSVYPIERDTRLMEVIGLAGGLLETADTSKVKVTRRGASAPIVCDLQAFLAGTRADANTVLEDGDVIQVPEKVPSLGSVFIYGAVRLPGQPVQLREGMKVSQAISAAGGITEQADTSRATVKRAGQDEPVQIDLGKCLAGDPTADITLQPGDIVTVPAVEQVGTFTILGGVLKSGEQPLRRDMTVSKACALAGLSPRAIVSRIRLTRASGSRKQASVPIDLVKITNGGAEDVVLQPGDTIFVPESAERDRDSTRWLVVAISLLGVLVGRR